jgi:hypothetical protein
MPFCPICQVEKAPKRRHTLEELAKFHPLAGHGKGGEGTGPCKASEGMDDEALEAMKKRLGGFCCEEARLAHEADAARLVAARREGSSAKAQN